uniref:Uncharacterized protein n=1 Tax=Tanacetum cinerariifolium TaxID=118510 RepID=A0A699J6B2_TANCI|nr:hypothetical protein [Tanacetum cinerariifolium]
MVVFSLDFLCSKGCVMVMPGEDDEFEMVAEEVFIYLCFTPNSQSIITSLRDGNLRVWSLPDCNSVIIPYERQNFTNTKYYHHLSISPDGNILPVAGASLLWWICVNSRRLKQFGNITGMAWAPIHIRVGDEYGFIFATVGDDGIKEEYLCIPTDSDEFPPPKQLPTANEDKFPLLIQSDATAEELCAAAEVKE